MNEITEHEANCMVAELVMGWTEGKCIETAAGNHYWLDKSNMLIMSKSRWQPTRDLNQCFEAIKALDKNIMIECISGQSYVEVNDWLGIDEIHDSFGVIADCESPNLKHAIVTALLEAVTGEKYEIKGE